jgi:hypothetical protein
MLDRQLKEVLDIFHRQELKYWLDSGTLLGLMRDGQLMEHDRDIDFSIWSSEEPKIKKIIPLFCQAGYQIYSASFRGNAFKYTFTPSNLQEARIIDIDIFREAREHAWCPMYYFSFNARKKNDGVKGNSTLGVLRTVIRSGWKKFNTKRPLHVKIDSLPWRAFVTLGTWWIPGSYFESIVYDHRLGAYIPKKWESYLAFRYGKWQEPCEDWVFYRDDHGIQAIHPETISGDFL